MKKIRKISIVLTILTGILCACHKKKSDNIVPSYVSVPDGFNITSPLTESKTSVSFATAGTNVAYNASFSDSVSWVLTITGKESGAVHVTQGLSRGLSDVLWTGAMDGITFFKRGEVATATLSFYGTSLSESVDVMIVTAPNYRTCGYFGKYAELDDPSKVTPANGWNGFNKDGTGNTIIANVEQGVDTIILIDRNGLKIKPPQGSGCYYIRGKGDQNVFVSGLGYGTYASGSQSLYTSLPTDPTQVWVNIYLYGSGDSNAQVQLEYQESADGRTSPNPSTDDYFVATVTLDHIGWKLFSFQYSTLAPSANKTNGGSGNKIHEPNKLWGYDVVLLKRTNPNNAVEVFFDYPIITVGGPFKPCF